MSVLEFHGYHVNNCQYTRNKNFKLQKRPISLRPNLHTHVDTKENNIYLTMEVAAGSLEKTNEPFLVSCSLTGHFVYRPEEDKNKIGLDNFVRTNAAAILYPYVRAIISMLTNNSNEFPGYNMPTINIGEALKKSEEKSKEQHKKGKN